MTDAQQREAARQFTNKWRTGGDEKQDCHTFWLGLLHDVLGVENALDYISFEKPVKLREGDGKIHTRYIDGYIPDVKVLIEQKGSKHTLDEKEPQSGGEMLTPYEQAKRYNDNLPSSEKVRWIVTCNFTNLWIYDMDTVVPEPQKIELLDLQTKYPLLDFLVKKEVKELSHEMEVSIQAGDIVGLIYDAFLKQYGVRWCLWLVGASPAELKKMPLVMERIHKVREMRLNSSDAGTRKLANTPTLFRETYNPKTFIIVPSATSEKRRYIPLGFLDENTISTNLNLIIPDATIYHFGILESNVHMAWMRVVCGRLKSDYRYSKQIVYNNFPWPSPSDAQKQRIEQTAQGILDARALYPDSSLADLYDPLTMPPELRKAHTRNDIAVMQAYGFSTNMSESDCVAALMKMYQELVEKTK